MNPDTMTDMTLTPRTDEAKERLARWQKRLHDAGMRGSHLDSDDPKPIEGWEMAETLERELATAQAELTSLKTQAAYDSEAIERMQRVGAELEVTKAEPERVTSEKDERPESVRQFEWILSSLKCTLIDISCVARDARKKHSVQGHQCELRKAIDSIADRAKVDMERTKVASEFYNTAELRERDQLRADLAAANAKVEEFRKEGEILKLACDSAGMDPNAHYWNLPILITHIAVERDTALARLAEAERVAGAMREVIQGLEFAVGGRLPADSSDLITLEAIHIRRVVALLENRPSPDLIPRSVRI